MMAEDFEEIIERSETLEDLIGRSLRGNSPRIRELVFEVFPTLTDPT